MKKFNIFLLIVAFALIFNACKKDKEDILITDPVSDIDGSVSLFFGDFFADIPVSDHSSDIRQDYVQENEAKNAL
ncbi:MAG: hypothetical protein M9887_10605 [Chitinophagales bacterium]|nr:hypothetical protein [Chitinophagales bacterium]